MFGVDAGTLDQKGSCWKQFWNIWRLCRSGASRRSNVATSPRRDILTSRRWVNYCASQQAATSQCLNVATSQRRDVSASSAFPPLKANGGADLGAAGGVRTRAQNSRVGVTPTSKKCP